MALTGSLQSDGWHMNEIYPASGDGGSRLLPTPSTSIVRFDGTITSKYTVTHTGTGGASAIDSATSPFTGALAGPSLKVNAASTRTEVAITGLSVANFDGHVVWNVYVQDHTLVQQVAPFAGTTGFGRLYQHTHSMIKGTGSAPHNGYHPVVAGPLSASVSATFVAGTDTLNEVKLRITGDGTGTGASAVWVHSVCIVAKGRPTMVFTHDDSSGTWIDNARPSLLSAGILACFGVMSSGITTHGTSTMTAADLALLVSDGHEIYGHNVANTALASPYGATEAATYAAAYDTGRSAVQALIGQSFSSLYHPWVQGVSSQAAVDALKSYGVRMARMAGQGANGYHNILAAAPHGGVYDHVMQMHTMWTNGRTTAEIDSIFDACLRYGTLVVWMTHEVTDTNTGINTSPAVYDYLMQRARRETSIAKRLPSELYAEMVAERLV